MARSLLMLLLLLLKLLLLLLLPLKLKALLLRLLLLLFELELLLLQLLLLLLLRQELLWRLGWEGSHLNSRGPRCTVPRRRFRARPPRSRRSLRVPIPLVGLYHLRAEVVLEGFEVAELGLLHPAVAQPTDETLLPGGAYLLLFVLLLLLFLIILLLNGGRGIRIWSLSSPGCSSRHEADTIPRVRRLHHHRHHHHHHHHHHHLRLA